MAGDLIISATCLRAVNSKTGQEIWRVTDHPGTILFSSCTSLQVSEDDGVVEGKDCVNGTTIPAGAFEQSTNFTRLMTLFWVILPEN